MYPASTVARLVGITAPRVRRWLQGYEYTYSAGPKTIARRQDPVVRRTGSADSQYASFLDLVDLLFVKRFLDRGLSLQKIRRALDEAHTLLGGHHFAHRHFFTDGKEIYMEVKSKPAGADALLELLSGGQWVIAPVIKALSHQIDFDQPTGFAERWYPLETSKRVVVDPRVSFGQPSVAGKNVTTSNVYDFYLAEDRNVDRVCSWMSVDRLEVVDVVTFEERLAAA
jgi:uncharacterized protein (DUF433 family)